MDTTRQIKVIKSVDIAKESTDNTVERLQARYQSAAGQQQSVIGEIFQQLRRLPELEQRIAALENR